MSAPYGLMNMVVFALQKLEKKNVMCMNGTSCSRNMTSRDCFAEKYDFTIIIFPPLPIFLL